MSKLSVDAAVFIPSQKTSPQLTDISPHLPQYVTTCYPFVQGDPGVVGKRVPAPNLNEPPPAVYHPVPVTSSHPPLTSLPYPHAVFPLQNAFPPPQNLVQQQQQISAIDVQCTRPPAPSGGSTFSDRSPRAERSTPRPNLPYNNTRPAARPTRPRQDGNNRRKQQYFESAQTRMAAPRSNRRMDTSEATTINSGNDYLPGSLFMASSLPPDTQPQTQKPEVGPTRVDRDDVTAPPFSPPDDDVTMTTQTFHPLATSSSVPPTGPPRMSYASVAKTPRPAPAPPTPLAENTPDTTETAQSNQPVKKRRKRTRKKKSKDGAGGTDTADERAPSPEPIVLAAADLRFEDENEFPGLLENTQNVFNQYASQPVMPYSSVLTGRPANSPWNAWTTNHQSQSTSAHIVQPISGSSDEPVCKASQSGMRSGSGHNSNASSTRSLDKAGKENKVSRKRRKRRELANEAAEKELLEISLEQQVLKQIGLKAKKAPAKPPPPPAARKSKEPVALNIAEMISALENQQISPEDEAAKAKSKGLKEKTSPVANLLDANPSLKRGKERETPKNKKPSTLKKVILKEREDRRRMRWTEETNLGGMTQFGEVDDEDGQGGKSQEQLPSGELSPVSQTSPISMSPVSPGGSPLSSEVTSPVQPGFIKSQAAMSIHSRRFREYCNQILDKDIDDCCVALLQDLVRFQDRVYHKEPNKVKSKRRFVLGLREVTKHLKLKKIKCVIISPNLERIQSKGGLDEALYAIISLCQEQDIPFVFALGRRALGRACAKLVPVSVVGVFNYDGSETNYHRLIELTEAAREQYNKMIKELETECEDASQKPPAQPTQIYAHMGHSRTPSGCSGISFASSMMSEPISELGRDDVTKLQVPEKNEYFRRAHLSHSRNSSLGKVSMVESITEADESHYEADTEEHPDSLTVVNRRETEVDDDDVDTIEDLPTLHEVDQAQDQLSSSSRTLSTTLQMTATSGELNEDGLSHRLKVIDQERIESWVEKAASSMQQLRLEEDSSEQSPSAPEL